VPRLAAVDDVAQDEAEREADEEPGLDGIEGQRGARA